MPSDRDSAIDRVLRPFTPLARQIQAPDDRLVELMYALVKDDTAFQQFSADPSAHVRARRIDPASVDLKMLADLATQLRNRKRGQESIFGRVAEEVSVSETHTAQETEWHTARSAETDSHSYVGQNKNFESSGTEINVPNWLLKHELKLLFYPAQPLVTPELVTQIKEEIRRTGS